MCPCPTHRIAELLGFDRQDQTRIATAVSELARNAYGYAGGGRAEFILDAEALPQRFAIRSALTNCDDVAFVFDRHVTIGQNLEGAAMLFAVSAFSTVASSDAERSGYRRSVRRSVANKQ
jgi:anti-sigma regulatory factor (Ser/Thr protein kinase)